MAVENHGGGFGGEHQRAVLAGQVDAHPVEPGRRHLAGERAAPDQAVEPRRVPVEMACNRFGRAPEIRRTDRLVGLPCVARPRPETLRPEGPRPRRDAIRAEAFPDDRARLGHRRRRHRGRIGARIGDEPHGLAAQIDPLVETLGDGHGLADAEAEPAERRQLQGCGRKRRVGGPPEDVALDGDRPEPRLADAPGGIPGHRFLRNPGLADCIPVQPDERRGEGEAVRRRRFGLHGSRSAAARSPRSRPRARRPGAKPPTAPGPPNGSRAACATAPATGRSRPGSRARAAPATPGPGPCRPRGGRPAPPGPPPPSPRGTRCDGPAGCRARPARPASPAPARRSPRPPGPGRWRAPARRRPPAPGAIALSVRAARRPVS